MSRRPLSPFRGAEFKRLQAQFYAKLRAEGFKDIENSHGQLIDHQSAADFSQRASFKSGYMEITRDYYTWASSMVSLGMFVTTLDRHIWELHAEGQSSREIERVTQIEQTWVCRKIKKIRAYLRLQTDFDAEKASE